MGEENKQYKVLARKYRPSTFADLIGQEALVRTVTNAISSGRIAQAYMLTGIRGVGKTTSARIIAKALNCTGVDGKGGMTPNPCGVCDNCRAIAEDRHIDVQEIDAASNTQVDNVRDIIQSAGYNPVSARYKVYIIDEVHMLSKGAANALLKLLEEPPERVKFIFATTEIRKVPVTILSRCQRFDLKRVEAEKIAEYFKEIVKKEKVKATDEAVDIIAKCADGSVRDGLSLLDQAIAHAAGEVDADLVREMLGLADQTAIFTLFEALVAGEAAKVLALADEQRDNGADALMLLQSLADLVYLLTRLKVNPKAAASLSLSETEKKKGTELAGKLSMAVLTRCWQMLMKGVGEVKMASASFEALEMLLVRMAYAALLPTPAEIIKGVSVGSVAGVGVPAPVPALTPTPTPAPAAAFAVPAAKKQGIETLNDVVKIVREAGYAMLALNMEKYLLPLEIKDKTIKVGVLDGFPHDIGMEISKALREKLDEEWKVAIVEDVKEGHTIKDDKAAKFEELKNEAKKDELIKAAMDAFPDAKVKEAVPLFDEMEAAEDDNNTEDMGEN